MTQRTVCDQCQADITGEAHLELKWVNADLVIDGNWNKASSFATAHFCNGQCQLQHATVKAKAFGWKAS